MAERVCFTPQELRRMPPDLLKIIQDGVREGRFAIVPSSHKGEGEGEIYPTTPSQENIPWLARLVAALHPKAIRSIGELISTYAEEEAARRIESGNLRQLAALNEMLEMFRRNPPLYNLLLAEAERYLPPGVEITELPPSELIGVLARATAGLTSLHTIIQVHEDAMGKNARRVADLFAGVDAALQMVPVAKQLPTATQSLEELNRNLVPYMNADIERRRRMAEHAQRKIETEIGKYVAIGTGVVTKAGAVLIAGVLSLPLQVGSFMKEAAAQMPLAAAGGLLGVITYALLNLDKDPFTSRYATEALVSFAVGMIGLPMVAGIIEGLATRSS